MLAHDARHLHERNNFTGTTVQQCSGILPTIPGSAWFTWSLLWVKRSSLVWILIALWFGPWTPPNQNRKGVCCNSGVFTCYVYIPIGLLKPDPFHLRFGKLCGTCFITAAQPLNAIWHSATLQRCVNLMLGHWEGGQNIRKSRKPKDSLFLNMFRSMSTKQGEHDTKACQLFVLASRALNWWSVCLFPIFRLASILCEIKMIGFRVCLYRIGITNATLGFGTCFVYSFSGLTNGFSEALSGCFRTETGQHVRRDDFLQIWNARTSPWDPPCRIYLSEHGVYWSMGRCWCCSCLPLASGWEKPTNSTVFPGLDA